MLWSFRLGAAAFVAWAAVLAARPSFAGDAPGVPRSLQGAAVQARSSRTPNCDALPLVVSRFEGRLQRAYVPVVKADGAQALFFLDTGAARTHLTHGLQGPETIAAAARVRFTCGAVTVDSWRNRGIARFAGLDVIGSVGAEVLIGAPTELDLDGGRLVRHAQIPEDARAWVQVPIEVKDGFIVTRGDVNGDDLRLLFDTGSEDTVLLSNNADETRAVTTTDAHGNAIRLLRTGASIRWGRAVPVPGVVWWTRSFPAFENTVRTWGGMGGALGLSAVGGRRLVFDTEHGRVYVEPDPAAPRARDMP